MFSAVCVACIVPGVFGCGCVGLERELPAHASGAFATLAMLLRWCVEQPGLSIHDTTQTTSQVELYTQPMKNDDV